MTDTPKQPTRVWKAARELGMTRVSVYRLIHNGTFKLEPWEGRALRITRESIEAYKALRDARLQEVLNEKEEIEVTVKEIRAIIARNKAASESRSKEVESEETCEEPTDTCIDCIAAEPVDATVVVEQCQTLLPEGDTR